MTRQKKIVNKIDRLQTGMEMDELMGCGLSPAVYKAREQEIYSLLEQLAQLQHCARIEEMIYDPRGYKDSDLSW